jgi:hypothetical protein
MDSSSPVLIPVKICHRRPAPTGEWMRYHRLTGRVTARYMPSVALQDARRAPTLQGHDARRLIARLRGYQAPSARFPRSVDQPPRGGARSPTWPALPAGR